VVSAAWFKCGKQRRFALKTETKTSYIADDGTRFRSAEACAKYEEKRTALRAMLSAKIGEYTDDELMLGGHALLDSLPFKAPWMSPFGACFIKVTDVRRTEAGIVEFQLADEANKPYQDGTAWAVAAHFYSEWPD
jgi:hypothetical protein